MATLQELLAEQQKLEQKIALLKAGARADAIAKVRQLMSEHGLTAHDLSAKPEKQSKNGARQKVAPKYRNQATGDTWSGRGLKPKWLSTALAEGKNMSDFAI